MVTETTSVVIKPYTVCAVQVYWEVSNPNIRGEFEEKFKERNLQRMCDSIDACSVGPIASPVPVKLICFPEFSIGGCYNSKTTTEEVKKYQAITIPGPETDVLAEKAKQYKIYIAAVNHENDPAIPDFFFNTAFIINPEGKIILKYRKLNCLFGCSPHDILSEYKNPITGTCEPFPVVDTRIGRLACMICSDLHWPEIPKIYALKGAEVLLRLAAGYSVGIARSTLRVRAEDNTIYIVNENWAAGVLTTEQLGDTRIITNVDASEGGGCMIIDYQGNVIAEAQGNAPQIVTGAIDIMALRESRKYYRPIYVIKKGDMVAQTRTELYAPYYNKMIFPPNQVLTEGPMNYGGDPSVQKRRNQALENREQFLDFYSENNVN